MRNSIRLLVLIFALTTSAEGQSSFGRIRIQDRDLFGQFISRSEKRLAILGPFGELNLLNVEPDSQFQVLGDKPIFYSAEQVGSALKSEFGGRYDVSTTRRFVVVHPWGSASTYAKPMEKMLDRFALFFENQELELKFPKFPLVAIILRSRNDFDRYLKAESGIKDRRIIGYYSKISNRMTTYDPMQKLRESNDDWMFRSPNIIHESVHQFAFNTGIHNRFAAPPKWLSEGLALLFEAPGIHQLTTAGKEKVYRLNAVQLKQLRTLLKKRSLRAEWINLIANDKLFQLDARTAYAMSWGLSFFLYETQPQNYFSYLKTDADRENFSPYDEQERLRQFAKAFGSDFELLEKRIEEFFVSRSHF